MKAVGSLCSDCGVVDGGGGVIGCVGVVKGRCCVVVVTRMN